MYQSRPQLCQSVRDTVNDLYGEAFHAFDRPIEYSIKVAECPAAGKRLFAPNRVRYAFPRSIILNSCRWMRFVDVAITLLRVILQNIGQFRNEIGQFDRLSNFILGDAEELRNQRSGGILQLIFARKICSIIGAPVNKATIQHIVRRCPPPTAEKQAVFEAWREAGRAAEKHLAAVPKKISFDRRKFAPYLDKLGSDRELENLFLEFLRERVK